MAYVSLLACHVCGRGTYRYRCTYFLESYMNEVVTLVPVAGVNFIEYRAKLVERFSNPYIKDASGWLDGSQKLATRKNVVEHFKARGVQLRRACISLRGVPAVLCDVYF